MEDNAGWDALLDDDGFLAEDSNDFLPDDSPNSPNEPGSPESIPDSPSSFQRALNDGTGFQEPDEVLPTPDVQSSHAETIHSSNEPHSSFPPRYASNPARPQQPPSLNPGQWSPSAHSDVGLPRKDLAQWPAAQNTFQPQMQRPTIPARGESFADQSRAGYKSPYDLPMDLSKPRKRVQVRQAPPAPVVQAPPAGPNSRGPEHYPGSAAAPLQPPFAPNMMAPGAGGPSAPAQYQNHVYPSVNRDFANEPGDGQNPRGNESTSTFYQELPITAKSRPPAEGRYTQIQTGSTPTYPPLATSAPQKLQQSHMGPPHPPSKSPTADSYFPYRLQQPERLDPYANVSAQPATPPVVPSTRYSPAPPASHTAPPPSRYSPAPSSSQSALPPLGPAHHPLASPALSQVSQTQYRYPSLPQPSPQLPPDPAPQTRYFSQPASTVASTMPFQPRTSSPLANHRHPIARQPSTANVRNEEPSATPSTHFNPQSTLPQDERPPSAESIAPEQDFHPPRRSQTQSPGKSGFGSRRVITSDEFVQRPASAHGPSSPATSANPFQSLSRARSANPARESSRNLNTNSHPGSSQQAELQRWCGSPIFHFGVGGTVLTSFPKHIPIYTAGSNVPVTRPVMGEVRIRDAKDIALLDDHVIRFPGPLRSKSKKKDVLSWLSDRISAVENMPLQPLSQRLPESISRHDEKVLLWKVVHLIVEHDGALDGSPEVEKAVSMLLAPASASSEETLPMHGTVDSNPAGMYKPAESQSSSRSSQDSDLLSVENLRRLLLRGEREKAVWTAVDGRLWGHAMLMSSTLDPSIWKQVAHEFVRQEVKHGGTNTQSLATLYEVFAGNTEDSIDELVPPSARAGFQMVSKAGSAGPTQNASEGLDKWRETLHLILSNRSREDHVALAALGRLLAGYGRIEAAHICFLFANSPMMPNVFSGADDSTAGIVLLGADHRSQPHHFFADADAVLLTECYEFATTVLPSNSKLNLMPHLQAYKVQRVRTLAEAGHRLEAQAYCEAIGVSLRSTTKLSPYYHPQFLAELDELTKRLSQTPSETSSWISRPTMGKVSDSMWNKFTTFVAGDDSDKASTGSGRDPGHESGPFAKVSGTPAMSRSGSSSDLYGAHASSGPSFAPNTLAGSRYAPNPPLSARSSSELNRGRPSVEAERSPLYAQQVPSQRSQYEPNGSLRRQDVASPHMTTQYGNPYTSLGASSPNQSYQATPPQTSYTPILQQESQVPGLGLGQIEPFIGGSAPQSVGSYMPAPNHLSTSYTQFSPSPEVSVPGAGANSSYTAPVQYQSSYEPPTTEYIPYEPEPESSPDAETKQSKPKKSFMDDDGDGYPPAVSVSQVQISGEASPSGDHQNVNGHATEADSKAPKRGPVSDNGTLKPKASWFGLFSRSKDSASADASTSSANGEGGDRKVIRANLGDENSFYYDKELKKWVNKKDPASLQPKASALPPPPKGPVSRVVSETLGGGIGTAAPPNLSTSRSPSTTSVSSTAAPLLPPISLSGPPSTTTTPPPSTSVPSAPPASATGANNPQPPPAKMPTTTPSDIDELLAGPSGTAAVGGRPPGGTVRSRRARGGAGRYVDVMANQ